MLQSNFSLFGNTTDEWDANSAGKIFKISDDQLKVLNSIPGWSTTPSTATVSTESILVHKSSESKISPSPRFKKHHHKDTLLSDSIIHNSSSNLRRYSAHSEKETFLKELSLCSAKNTRPVKKRRSCSVTDISSKSISETVLPRSTSGNNIFCNTDNSSLPEPKSDMNNEKFQVNYLKSNLRNNLETAEKLSKRSLRLSDRVLNHKFFKVAPTHSEFSVTESNSGKPSDLNKKLQLLEKRMSPAKEGTNIETQVCLKSSLASEISHKVLEMNPEPNQISSQPQNKGQGKATDSIDSVGKESKQGLENVGMPKSNLLLDKDKESGCTTSQITNQLTDASNSQSMEMDQVEKQKETAGTISLEANCKTSKKAPETSSLPHKEELKIEKANINFEEIFLSQPIPCGQKLTFETYSQAGLCSPPKSKTPTKTLPVVALCKDDLNSTRETNSLPHKEELKIDKANSNFEEIFPSQPISCGQKVTFETYSQAGLCNPSKSKTPKTPPAVASCKEDSNPTVGALTKNDDVKESSSSKTDVLRKRKGKGKSTSASKRASNSTNSVEVDFKYTEEQIKKMMMLIKMLQKTA